MQFEWDTEKAETNIEKHEVSFEKLKPYSEIRWLKFLMIIFIQLRKNER
jgi:uncharacterized DUF497 family protein